MKDAWVSQGETTVLNKPAYFACIEEFRRGKDQMVFGHLTVHKWTPSVFKMLLKDWKLFRECVTCPIYAVSEDGTQKFSKFISALGFRFLTNVICENGEHRPLFVHTNNNKAKNVRKIEPRHNAISVGDLDDKPVVNAGSVSDASVSGS